MKLAAAKRFAVLWTGIGISVGAGVTLADLESAVNTRAESATISFDMRNVTYSQVAERISAQFGAKVVVVRPLQDRRISILVDASTPEEVLSGIASLHGISWRVDDEGVYHLYRQKNRVTATTVGVSEAISNCLPQDFREYLRLELKKPDKNLIDPGRFRDIGPKRNVMEIVQNIIARDWNKEQAELIQWFTTKQLAANEELKFSELPAEERERVILILMLRAIFNCNMSVLRAEPSPLHINPSGATLSIDGNMIWLGGYYEVDGRKVRAEIGTEIVP